MISRVKIETIEKQGITQLKSIFTTSPFKFLEIREDKKNPVLELMLMSSSPGVLDHDELYFEYLLHENSQVEIKTQSFQRLFTMENSAMQEIKITLKENSFLTYLPHPTVPHKNSNFKSENTIFLENNASLIWSEILTCGRKNKNEVFEFNEFQAIARIYKNNKLVLFENLYFNPSEFNPLNLGQLEGFTHQLSFIYLCEKSDIKKLKKELDTFLNEQNCVFGISETSINGLIVKIVHYQGEKLMTLSKELAKKITKND